MAWSRYIGPMFVVAIPEEPRFVGIVRLADRDDGIVEMIFGIAPRWRDAVLPAAQPGSLRIWRSASASAPGSKRSRRLTTSPSPE
jgi:hypothetical protein